MTPERSFTAGTDIFQKVSLGHKACKTRINTNAFFIKFATELVGIEFEVISQTNPLEHIRPHGVFSQSSPLWRGA